ncbi:isochorismate lyase [Brenneria izadpanahii]|uniref:chorismate mutase n=1 Tax=Brenneria izadpanahii TaxID=2722756 RepID=A0ABX7UZE0_9GAMM|nr:isochorismate lyase [Brenneria izadpanahii]QTF10156.1 isochorismate lyase [Brenneria izadpanahii]
MLSPNECRNLQDVREGIDTIDKQIFSLFLQRLEYVYAASQFKPDEASIAAPDRVTAMLDERRRWARKQQANEDFITSLYEHIIYTYIREQTEFWRKKNNKTA